LDIGVLGYIGIVRHKEHSPEVLSIPPGTPCIYTHVIHNIRDAGWAKEIKKNGIKVNVLCQGSNAACHFGHACHRLISPGLDNIAH